MNIDTIRFIALRAGLAGKTEMEQGKVDMVAACADDFVQLYMISIYYEKDEQRKVWRNLRIIINT